MVLPGLLAAAASAPALIGLQLERGYRATVAQMAADGLRVTRSEYQRGWLSSKAETDLVLAMPAGDDQRAPRDLVLTLRNDIDHGPLLQEGAVLMGRVDTQLLANGETMFSPHHPAEFSTRVALLGDKTSVIVDLPARAVAGAGDHPGLEFEGLAGELHFGQTRGSLDGELAMTGLALVVDGQPVIRARGVTANWQMLRGVGGLLFGDARLGLEGIEIADPVQGTRVSLQGFVVESKTRIADEQVEMRLSYTLARASVDDSDYGPADVRLRLGNLSAQVLGRIREQLAQNKARELDRDQKPLAALGILMTNAPHLLQNDPVFAIERLHLETPDGAVEGSLSMQAQGMVWPASDPAEPLRRLTAMASLRLPEPVFRALLEPGARERQVAALEARRLAGEPVEETTQEQREEEIQQMVGQQLADIIGQGILRRNHQELTLSARLRGGRLEINGRGFPLPFAP